MPYTFSGYRNTTLVLNNPGAQNPATVTQFGTINVNSTAAYTPGVLGTNGFPWTLTNNGTIQSVGNLGIGVNFQAGGSISNVPVVGTAGLTGGVIIGTGNAVQITGAAGTVNNSGTISHSGVAQANGIFLGAGGTISNTGTISASGSFSSAINLGNGPGNVLNNATGLISAVGIAISTGSVGGSSVVTNYGTIRSTGFGNYPAIQLRSGGAITNGTTPGSTALITAAISVLSLSTHRGPSAISGRLRVRPVMASNSATAAASTTPGWSPPVRPGSSSAAARARPSSTAAASSRVMP